jgi:hypothetical protein
MLKLNPTLRIYLRNNTIPGAQDSAKSFRARGKIPAEYWGPASAIFLGDGWSTDSGQGLLQKMHTMLRNRAEVEWSKWTTDALINVAQGRTRMIIIAELRANTPGALLRRGVDDALSFPLLVSLFCLVALLVLTAGAFPRPLVLGLGYWLGAVGLLAFYALGKLGPLIARRDPFLLPGRASVLYLFAGIAFLVIAGLRWRLYRRTVLAPPTPAAPADLPGPDASAAEGGAEELPVPASAEPAPAPRGALRALAVAGVALGVALTFASVMLNPPTSANIIAESWQLGDVAGLVLPLLACYVLAVTLPLLLAAILAGVLTGHAAVRRRGVESPADSRFAAFAFFLVVGAFLLAQAAVTFNVSNPGG